MGTAPGLCGTYLENRQAAANVSATNPRYLTKSSTTPPAGSIQKNEVEMLHLILELFADSDSSWLVVALVLLVVIFWIAEKI